MRPIFILTDFQLIAHPSDGRMAISCAFERVLINPSEREVIGVISYFDVLYMQKVFNNLGCDLDLAIRNSYAAIL